MRYPQSARLLQMLPRERELTFWELSEDRALPQFPVRASMTESVSLLDAKKVCYFIRKISRTRNSRDNLFI